MTDYAIEVKNITKTFKVYLDKGNTLKERSLFSSRRKYQTREVLKGISFKAKKGETIGLIGHNGCGKSTTLKLLTRIMYPDSGEIIMKGRVSSLIELGAGFHPDMSGRENIYINASIFGLTKKEIDERVDDIIAFSELEEFIDNPVRTYSSGMYTRLAFAVAINVNADILLVDEILSVGDENFQAKCYDKMSELKASGITIVLVTHSLGTVKSFCDRAIWIHEGLVKSEGKASDVADEYLAFMNKVRMDAINEQMKKQEAETRAETDFVDEEATMDITAKRFGNRRAIITDCRIINENGESVTAISASEDFQLEIDYQVRDEKLEHAIFGMGIFTLDGQWLFGTNTRNSGMKLNVKKCPSGTVRFNCGPLLLQNNIYKLQVSIIQENNTPCDYHNEYMRFNIVNPCKDAGIILYPAKWEAKDIEEKE